MKKIAISLTVCLSTFLFSANLSASDYYLKINRVEADRQEHIFKMGTAVNPKGSTIEVNSRCMLFDGKPMLPVMGEFHFSRFADKEWKKELLKMKAGGITVVATYIFWIHHEEVEGEFDWEGQRNLRRFIQACREVGLPVVIRVGPWCHGEVRNGGFPEWLVSSGIKLRESNQAYLSKVQLWYSEVYKQVEGLLWKDGGPIIGMQIENEYRGRGEHLTVLKKMARETGFDVPMYTRTGWPKLSTPVPYGEIIPLYGDYSDGFWDRSIKEMPGDYGKSYIFRSFRNSTVIATEQLPQQSDKDNPDDVAYPYFTCELGGGMMPSYHRRINIAPMDVYAMALVRVGSGSNLPGYYMYHGGTNPDGKLSTLNEHQATNYTNHNDLPVRSYDFQAPLAEFGQVNPHYHLLRKLHLFLGDFGSELTAMPPYFPEQMQSDFKADSLLRWAVRSNGTGGYIFVNNYHRLKPLSAKNGVQFALDLPDGKLLVPQSPISLASGASFFIPFNMRLANARMVYATAQPITKLIEDDNVIFVFSQIQGVTSEFVFSANGLKVESSVVKPQVQNGELRFSNVKAGTGAAICLRDANGKTVSIVLLDDAASLACWKGRLAGKERLFITHSNLTYDGNELALENTASLQSVSIYPPLASVHYNGVPVKGASDGIFTKYTVSLPKKGHVKIGLEKVKDFDLPLRTIVNGKRDVAEMPSDDDFAKAAVWKIVLPENLDLNRDINLRISYVGDVARVYSDGGLLTDNFYNGKSFNLNLKYFASQLNINNLLLNFLPLQKAAPIYIPSTALPDFKQQNYIISAPKIEVVENQSVLLIAN